MSNGIDWKRISGEEEHPIERIKSTLKDFAKSNNFKLHYSTYHDSLDIEFLRNCHSRKGKYYIAKRIRIGLVEMENKLSCSISVYVNNHYGLKELLLFFPYLRKIRSKWQRKKWSQRIGYIDFPIDLKELQSFLNQAKQILDNFDESMLQEVK